MFREVINLDTVPNPTRYWFGAEKVPYIQIYSFIRDRIRAVRVDLHVQQPLSTITQEYIKTHEAAFRFELLSLFVCPSATGIVELAQSAEMLHEKIAVQLFHGSTIVFCVAKGTMVKVLGHLVRS